MRMTVGAICFVALLLGGIVIFVGRLMERIERTRISMGGNPGRYGGKVILAGAALFVPALAGVLLIIYVWKE